MREPQQQALERALHSKAVMIVGVGKPIAIVKVDGIVIVPVSRSGIVLFV
jgi:hypothetical protein